MFAMNIESAPSSAQLDEAQSLVNTNIDTSQVDGLLGAVGQQGALDGVKGQLAGLQGQAGGQLAQMQKARGMLDQLQSDSASEDDKLRYGGSNIFKKLAFVAIKGVQVYIVYEIMTGAGGIFEVSGAFLPYIPALIVASFAIQLLDFIMHVAPAMGAKILHEAHADFLIPSVGTANVMVSTALIQCVAIPEWGATGYIVEFLQTLVQYQVMLGNFDSGVMAVFNPMPPWMKAFVAWLEDLPRILWEKLVFLVLSTVDVVLCRISVQEYLCGLIETTANPYQEGPTDQIKQVEQVTVHTNFHVEQIDFKFSNPVSKGTKNYDAPTKSGKASFFSETRAPFKLEPGHIIKKVRWHEDSQRLLSIQFVAASTSIDVQELLGKHVESDLYGDQDVTHMKEYTAPISSLGIVGIEMRGTGKKPVGPITGFVVVERDGSLRTEPLVQNKEIGEITGLVAGAMGKSKDGKPIKPKAGCFGAC